MHEAVLDGADSLLDEEAEARITKKEVSIEQSQSPHHGTQMDLTLKLDSMHNL